VITCREFVDFLDRYVEGTLTAEERETFEHHIVDCPPCGDYLDSYRMTIGLCREAFDDPGAQVSSPEIPEDLIRAILEAKKR
jgi:anti-sigma factor RsiW